MHARALSRQQTIDSASVYTVRHIDDFDHVLGSRDAPVQMVVYTDYSCPYCKSFHERAVPQIIQRYGASVAIVYRNLPLEYLHPRARAEAVAAECVSRLAGETAYWNYASQLFELPELEKGAPDHELLSRAELLGIPDSDFLQCTADPTIAQKVQADILEARTFGVYKTPSAIVRAGNSQVLVSGVSLSTAIAAIQVQLIALSKGQ